MPNGLIAEDSLRVHPDGLALSLTLPWYRSLWLSSVGTLKVSIDGVEVSAADIAFELKGVRYTLDQLPEQSDVLWYLQEHPLLIVRREAPIALGETHTVEIFGELRLPYMQIAPGQDGGGIGDRRGRFDPHLRLAARPRHCRLHGQRQGPHLLPQIRGRVDRDRRALQDR